MSVIRICFETLLGSDCGLIVWDTNRTNQDDDTVNNTQSIPKHTPYTYTYTAHVPNEVRVYNIHIVHMNGKYISTELY